MAGKRMVGLSHVLDGVLDRAGLGHLVHEEKLRRNWGSLMGPKASGIASLESLRGYTLKIRVESSTWRQELHYQREAVRERANALLGGDLVKEVVLV